MTAATLEDRRADQRRLHAESRAAHWWAGKTLRDALRLLWDAARDRGGLPASEVRGVLLTFRPEAADCALRRALDRGHLIEVRRHLPCGGVVSIFHPMGKKP